MTAEDELDMLESWGTAGGRAGRGSEFGVAVHHLFRRAIRRRSGESGESDDLKRVQRAWRQFDVAVRETEGVEALRALRGSGLWRRMEPIPKCATSCCQTSSVARTFFAVR